MNDLPANPDPLDGQLRKLVQSATPARLFLPGGPAAYDTGSWLALRADHAAARDAVRSDLNLADSNLAELLGRRDHLKLESAAPDLPSYLARPDLGRRLSRASAESLEDRMKASHAGPAEMAIVVGDGLSPSAVSTHAADLVEALTAGATTAGWRVRAPLVVVRRCRVGILNDLGPRLDADVLILVIGERPGLATADSLSAYLAYHPEPGHSDANRNLISGIHARGTPVPDAAARVIALAARLIHARRSGVEVKEQFDLPASDPTRDLGTGR